MQHLKNMKDIGEATDVAKNTCREAAAKEKESRGTVVSHVKYTHRDTNISARSPVLLRDTIF